MTQATRQIEPRRPSASVWVDFATRHADALLDDHAQCELKAATNALALVGRHPEKDSLVRALSALAAEEMRHYRLVRRVLRGRGGSLSKPLRSPYLQGLMRERRGGEDSLLEELLVAAVVEARSCERFHRLAEAFAACGERRLADMYERLIRSEEGHARLFVELAECYYPRERVHAELERRLELDDRTLAEIPLSARMHGGYRTT